MLQSKMCFAYLALVGDAVLILLLYTVRCIAKQARASRVTANGKDGKMATFAREGI
jgi:hypothetical protein